MSQTDEQLPSEMVPFRNIQIIAGALIFGVLVLAAIAVFVAQGQQGGNALLLLAYVAAAFSAVELIVSFFVPAIATRQKLQELRAQAGEVSAMDYFGVYSTQIIVRAALLEGAALLCCIAYMNTQAWWILATGLALAAVIGIFFPTRGRFDDWVRAERELRALDDGAVSEAQHERF
jgi:hypothetical protein